MREAPKKIALPPQELIEGGGAQNLNCKFKAFGFFDTLKVNIQFNQLHLSFKHNQEKKNRKLIFYALHSSVTDLKSFIALSSRKGGTLYPCPAPLCTPFLKTEIQGYLQRMRSLVRPITGVQWSEFISIQGRRLLCLCFDF